MTADEGRAAVEMSDKEALRPRALTLFVVAGEHSGDALGAKLMAALDAAHPGPIHYVGVGGEGMQAHGLTSLFPLSDVAVMGPLAILKNLRRIVRRVYEAVAAGVAAKPDAVVIIDAPEFTHAIAKRFRRRMPDVAIIDYVSPTVWAWRPGRARAMSHYVDHVLALLPFEPEAHRRLGGPACTYVGHPLIERMAWIRSRDPIELAARLGLDSERPVLVVLPGSRTSEVGRLLAPFAETIGLLAKRENPPQVIIPAVSHVRDLIKAQTAGWPVPVKLVEGEADKFAAFRLARAALAASGTVTLELAVAGTPMVVAYRVDPIAANLRFLVKVPSVVLANLVLGEAAFPEYLQERCTPELMAGALVSLLEDTPERQAQLAALARIPDKLLLETGTPSEAAAAVVLDMAAKGRPHTLES